VASRGTGKDEDAIPALKVRQWLDEWDEIEFDPDSHRRRPDPHFYILALSAPRLLALSGIYRRSITDREVGRLDLGIQRRHDVSRSDEIRDFVRYGYPWSSLSPAKRSSDDFDDLRKPGWLPTSIVVNILRPDDKRGGAAVAEDDLVRVEDAGDQGAKILLPPRWADGSNWVPAQVPPIEIIDGQHRLLAFEDSAGLEGFELPVVAFHGLDLSWQAYLFWTINIRPKRINASLAFDLYPLLRTESWLEPFDGHSIYRETRSQELTEALWAHPKSVWYHRINMLGEPGQGGVSQASWIRSLVASYVKAREGRGISIGGLFGAPLSDSGETLPWSRAQQAAFLILVWRQLYDAVRSSEQAWATGLRKGKGRQRIVGNLDPAFAGPLTLLNTDPGVRGVLQVTNDLCFRRAGELHLDEWAGGTRVGLTDERTIDEGAIDDALVSLVGHPVEQFLGEIAQSLATYDWRTSAAEGLTEEQKVAKLALRGSGGYRELRRQLLHHLEERRGDVGNAASEVTSILGY
jgi:DNA-sulfur modification-associated